MKLFLEVKGQYLWHLVSQKRSRILVVLFWNRSSLIWSDLSQQKLEIERACGVSHHSRSLYAYYVSISIFYRIFTILSFLLGPYSTSFGLEILYINPCSAWEILRFSWGSESREKFSVRRSNNLVGYCFFFQLHTESKILELLCLAEIWRYPVFKYQLRDVNPQHMKKSTTPQGIEL